MFMLYGYWDTVMCWETDVEFVKLGTIIQFSEEIARTGTSNSFIESVITNSVNNRWAKLNMNQMANKFRSKMDAKPTKNELKFHEFD